MLRKASTLLLFFIFISCSNLNSYDTSLDAYYVTNLIDFSDGKNLKVICFELPKNNKIDACYDFDLVEDLYSGNPLPSAMPVAFIDNENNDYLKGSHLFTAWINQFTFNGIPLLWVVLLIIIYGLFKLITGRNDVN